MSEELKRLQEKRAQIADKMVKMVDKAEAENRGLNPEERTQWGAMRVELDDLDPRIADLKEAEALKRSIEVPLSLIHISEPTRPY